MPPPELLRGADRAALEWAETFGQVLIWDELSIDCAILRREYRGSDILRDIPLSVFSL